MSTHARIRSPYRIVSKIALEAVEQRQQAQRTAPDVIRDCEEQGGGLDTYPKPIHPTSANSAFVATTPTEFIRGSIPAVANAATSARNELRIPPRASQPVSVSIHTYTTQRREGPGQDDARIGTHALAAIDSALRSCKMSTKYEEQGVRTTSSCGRTPPEY